MAIEGRLVRSVTLRDLDGTELASALLRDGPDGRRLSLERVVAGKGRLLHHYFGDGRRIVLLDLGDVQFRGVLSTMWLGAERRWFVDLPPAEAGLDSIVGAEVPQSAVTA